jgi:hypothetical protein
MHAAAQRSRLQPLAGSRPSPHVLQSEHDHLHSLKPCSMLPMHPVKIRQGGMEMEY